MQKLIHIPPLFRGVCVFFANQLISIFLFTHVGKQGQVKKAFQIWLLDEIWLEKLLLGDWCLCLHQFICHFLTKISILIVLNLFKYLSYLNIFIFEI